MRKTLIKKIKELCVFELINVFWLPFCFWLICYINGQRIGQNTISAMILSGVLLLEGSLFWFMVLQQLKKKTTFTSIYIFKLLKVVNIVLMLVTLILIINTAFEGVLDLIGTCVFFLLAVLEHINYFEVQLMYSSENDKAYWKQNRRLKTSKLKKLLRK